MDKKKKTVVVTGSMVAKVACVLGLISCVLLLVSNYLNGTEPNWSSLLGMAVTCGITLYLTGEKQKS